MKNTSAEQIIIDATTVHLDIDKSYSLTQEFLRGVRNVKYENAETWLKSRIESILKSNSKEFVDLTNMFKNGKRK